MALPIIIIVAFILVTNLSVKNNTLGFISDDSRQITLVCDLYSQILNTELNSKTNLSKDTSIYINFITYGHYVISNETKINESFKNDFLTDDTINCKKMLLSNSFDVKNLTLKISLKDTETTEEKIYTYKLGKDKKNNMIKYKLINTENTIE